ncbi:hypothetical protein IOK_04981 [Yersinia enterocolitica subsp. palearctica PhRBD_Ye1]|nr:hypothetical protein IOK_04981 [Yersinia enterocolitica subsp. palearctica PhRBD_Ye1]UXD24301.1 hypothetical protein FORC065_1438 [Yersinia enterocolitica]UXD30252.1 hypothetical protein FORC066_3045 [Yersinia enterocolitica]
MPQDGKSIASSLHEISAGVESEQDLGPNSPIK